MRFWVYDETGTLLRKFNYREEAQRHLSQGCYLIVQSRQKRIVPSVEQYGEALW